MPRPNLSAERRRRFIPEIARTFADLGYRRTTTAELARRCNVRENILYRLWEDKKAMFIASIDYVFELSVRTWRELLEGEPGPGAPERLLDYEARHHGEFGFYRIVFAGLSEAGDEDIRKALTGMFGRFHEFIAGQVAVYRESLGPERRADPALSAWAIIGLGTIANIGREFDLFPAEERVRLIREIGKVLLTGVM